MVQLLNHHNDVGHPVLTCPLSVIKICYIFLFVSYLYTTFNQFFYYYLICIASPPSLPHRNNMPLCLKLSDRKTHTDAVSLIIRLCRLKSSIMAVKQQNKRISLNSKRTKKIVMVWKPENSWYIPTNHCLCFPSPPLCITYFVLFFFCTALSILSIIVASFMFGFMCVLSPLQLGQSFYCNHTYQWM
jgi:hypothetical protein